MERVGTKNAIRILLAVFVLSLSIVAKTPNIHCHCSDPIKSVKQDCVFGQLRILLASTLHSTPSPIIDLAIRISAEPTVQPLVLLTYSFDYFDGRAPPF